MRLTDRSEIQKAIWFAITNPKAAPRSVWPIVCRLQNKPTLCSCSMQACWLSTVRTTNSSPLADVMPSSTDLGWGISAKQRVEHRRFSSTKSAFGRSVRGLSCRYEKLLAPSGRQADHGVGSKSSQLGAGLHAVLFNGLSEPGLETRLCVWVCN